MIQRVIWSVPCPTLTFSLDTQLDARYATYLARRLPTKQLTLDLACSRLHSCISYEAAFVYERKYGHNLSPQMGYDLGYSRRFE
jgi:hypothetical protein